MKFAVLVLQEPTGKFVALQPTLDLKVSAATREGALAALRARLTAYVSDHGKLPESFLSVESVEVEYKHGIPKV